MVTDFILFFFFFSIELRKMSMQTCLMWRHVFLQLFFSCGKKPKLAALDFLAGGHCRKVLGLQGLVHKMAPIHKMAPLNLASGMRASGQREEDTLPCRCVRCPALSPACCSHEWFKDIFLRLDLLVLKADLVSTPFRRGVPCLSYTCGAPSSMISMFRCS